MKWNSGYLAILLLSFSQYSHALTPSNKQPDYNALKIKMVAILNNGISNMDNSKSCYETVKTEAEFNKCTSAMSDNLKQDIVKYIYPSTNILNLKAKYEQTLNYSLETNRRIIKYLDQGIQNSRTLLQCVNTAINVDQMLGCMNGKPSQNISQPAKKTTNKENNYQLSEDW